MNEEERENMKQKLEFLAYAALGNIEVDRQIDVILVYLDALIQTKKSEVLINFTGEK